MTMDRKDNGLSNEVFNNEQEILDRYKGLFFEKEFDEEPYYIEKGNPEKNSSFRFFLTPGGAVAVSSFVPSEIWSLTGERDTDQALLLQLNIVARENRSFAVEHLVKELHSYSKIYFLRILPYGDTLSFEVIKTLLDPRYEAYKSTLLLQE